MTWQSAGSILVTGATGKTGRRVVEKLLANRTSVLAASRHPGETGEARGVTFDWHDAASTRAALGSDDIRAVYLVPPVRDPDPAAVMVPFLEAARAAGVERVVLLSAKPVPAGGPGVGLVHERLPEIFTDWAVLRPSWFMQDFTGEHYLARMLKLHGTISTASGQGRLAFIDADDIAEVATSILLSPTAPNRDLILTGPDALSYADVASILSRVTGVNIESRQVTEVELAEQLAESMPAELATLLARADHALGTGNSDDVTQTVQDVTGRQPSDLATYAQAAWDTGQLRVAGCTRPPALNATRADDHAPLPGRADRP